MQRRSQYFLYDHDIRRCHVPSAILNALLKSDFNAGRHGAEGYRRNRVFCLRAPGMRT